MQTQRCTGRIAAAIGVIGAATILIAGCGDGEFPPEMRRMMGMMGQQNMELPAGISAGELPDRDSRGARLVATYCSQCHGIPSPRRHAADDWEATTRRMFRRMAHMEHMGGMMGRGMMGRMGDRRMMDVRAPTSTEEREILAYLQSHAMRATRREALPASRGREDFVRACSRCHALPDPSQHVPDEWPAVVERMQENMERMSVEGITDAEAWRIVRYLESAARSPSP